MKNDFSNLKNILKNFINQIDDRKKIAKSIYPNFPEFDDDHPKINGWEQEQCFIWLYAEPYYYLLPKDQKKHQIPKCFFQPAITFFNEWQKKDLDIQAYEKLIIQPPNQNETLKEYLHKLYFHAINKNTFLKDRWKKSLTSFCSFLRKEYLEEEEGFLDCIFPEHINFSSHRILRKVPENIYPIDILDTKNILSTFSNIILNGRKNIIHTTAESLAILWINLAIANTNTLAKITSISTITEKNLFMKSIPKEKHFFKTFYYLIIPSLFYEDKIIISKTLYNFLLALSKINNGPILSRSLNTLRKRFRKNLKNCKLSAKHDEISFQTFLSNPHELIGHRYRSSKKQKTVPL